MRLYLSRTEQYAVVVLLLAIIGALFVLSYAYGKRERDSEQQPFLAQSAASAGAENVAGDEMTVVVHVAGAVHNPGVYNLPAGGRVIDALKQAGGACADGCPDALNLAARLQDGERLYIPTKVEWQKTTAVEGPPALVTPDASVHTSQVTRVTARASAPKAAATVTTRASDTTPQPATQHGGPKPLPTSPVNLNTATLDALQTLPGVGPSTAQKILDYRNTHGKFTDLAELLNVPGIGQKKYEKLAPYIKL